MMRWWRTAKSWSARNKCSGPIRRLVARCGERRSLLRNRVSQYAAHRRKQGSRHRPLALDTQFRNFPGKLPPAIEPQAELPEKVSGNVGIVRPLHSPEPQALFILLQQLKRFLQLLHGRVERRCEEIDRQRPAVVPENCTHPHVVFPVLILLDGAEVFITRCCRFSGHCAPHFLRRNSKLNCSQLLPPFFARYRYRQPVCLRPLSPHGNAPLKSYKKVSSDCSPGAEG